MEHLSELVSVTPPFVWPLVVLVALITYRLIPVTKRMPVYAGLTIKDIRQPNVTVQVRQFMIVAVSVCVLAASLYIILSRAYDDSAQKWAYGAVGMIVGHWFKK